MAVINVEMTGAEEIWGFRERFPKEIKEQMMLVAKRFCDKVQKSAKLRAPRDTGELADSIDVKKHESKNRVEVVVGSPYGWFQEYGFKPHPVGPDTKTRRKSGATTLGQLWGITHPIWVSKYTPFLTPAFEKWIAHVPALIKQQADEVIQKSK